MKINAINNTNFKGLFTNKTEENNGLWRMEYQPYSWEKKNYGDYNPGMSRQTEIDVESLYLPDNEKIYTGNPSIKESCSDILGTEFYFCDRKKNVARKTITEMPAMTLEDSLRVKVKKLGKFIEMKYAHRKELEKEFTSYESDLNRLGNEYKEASSDYHKDIFDRTRNKSANKTLMDLKHSLAMNKVNDAFRNMKKYFEFINGIKHVIDLSQRLNEEADKLTKARKSGNLIDISRRDIYDPNKPLWDSIQEMIKTKTLETSNKLIALPDRTISMQEIINALGNKIKSPNVSEEIIGYVDMFIKSGRYY